MPEMNDSKEIGADWKKLNEQYKLFRHQNNLTINSKSAQNTCINLINSIKAFYKLRKNSENNAHCPKRYKGHEYFCTFTLDFNNAMGRFSNQKQYINIIKQK